MSDLYYNVVWCIGRPAFWVSASPTVLHRERADRAGAFILAATHLSPYDVPLLIAHTRRLLDFVSIVEVFRHPLSAWFLGSMNAFPLDRGRPDGPTVRVILDRLSRGRAIAMFPEGTIRTWDKSVMNGGPMKPGAARLAQLAKVPLIPAVVLGSEAYSRVSSWMPLRRTPYGVNYGEPITVPEEEGEAGIERASAQLRQAYVDLAAELMTAAPVLAREMTPSVASPMS